MADGQVKLEKAQLALIQPRIEWPARPRFIGNLEFKFNPKEYTLQKSASWQRSPVHRGADSDAGVHRRPAAYDGARTFSRRVRQRLRETSPRDIELLLSCLTPLPATVDANTPSPPFIRFSWGSTISFIGFLRSVSARVTCSDRMARRCGRPATCSWRSCPCRLGDRTQRREARARRGSTPLSPATRCVHRLPRYGDPQRWRTVAEANGIDDPSEVPFGQRIIIPSLPPDRRGVAR